MKLTRERIGVIQEVGRGGWGDAGPTDQGKKALAMQRP